MTTTPLSDPDFVAGRTRAGRLPAWVACWLVLFGCVSNANAGADTPSATTADVPPVNHVLVLPGNGAYVRLPTAPFRTLTNATLECWVRWDVLEGTRRVFNFGRPLQDISLCSRDGDSLGLVMATSRASIQWLTVPDTLRTGQWYHVAAVVGHEGMRLHLNGLQLRPTSTYRGSFDDLARPEDCYLGRSVTAVDAEPTFVGALDEFRVWDHARAPGDILLGMFRRATAGENGLVFAADFEPAPASGGETETPLKPFVDLQAGAHLESMDLPRLGDFRVDASFTGDVLDARGKGVDRAFVVAAVHGTPVVAAVTDDAGRYHGRLQLPGPAEVRFRVTHWLGEGGLEAPVGLRSGRRRAGPSVMAS